MIYYTACTLNYSHRLRNCTYLLSKPLIISKCKVFYSVLNTIPRGRQKTALWLLKQLDRCILQCAYAMKLLFYWNNPKRFSISKVAMSAIPAPYRFAMYWNEHNRVRISMTGYSRGDLIPACCICVCRQTVKSCTVDKASFLFPWPAYLRPNSESLLNWTSWGGVTTAIQFSKLEKDWFRSGSRYLPTGVTWKLSSRSKGKQFHKTPCESKRNT